MLHYLETYDAENVGYFRLILTVLILNQRSYGKCFTYGMILAAEKIYSSFMYIE